MSNKSFLLILFLLLTATGENAFPQEGHDGRDHAKTVRQALQHRNIGLDRDSLVKALQNSSATVRWLAASQLTEKGSMVAESIPFIVYALQTETDPVARLNIADALANVGNSNGIEILKQVCKDTGQSTPLRLRSVRYLLNLGDESCLADLLMMLHSEPRFRQASVSLLPRFHPASEKQLSQVRQAVRLSLSDQEELVRIAAADALVRVKDVDGIGYLRQAVANERIENVRAEMAKSLKSLEIVGGK